VRKGTDLTAQFANGTVPAAIEDVTADSEHLIRGKSNGIDIDSGDVVEATIVGGGGYGDPLDRAAALVEADVRAGKVSAAAARRVYQVVLDQGGQVDTAATEQLRATARQTRRGWAALSAPVEPTTAATGQPERSVHEYIVAKDEGASRVLACAACGTRLSDYAGRFKYGLLTHDQELGELPGFIDPAIMLDDHVVLRQYACRGCGTIMAAEVVKAGEDPLDEMVLS
jgi:N-methylhydantoinase B